MKKATEITPHLRVTEETKIRTKFVLEGVKTLEEEKITPSFKVLDGVITLKIQNITIVSKVIRKINPETNNMYIFSKKNLHKSVKTIMSIELMEVTAEELAVYRKSKISSFVLKINNKLYYASIPNDISFASYTILGPHKCALIDHECKRLSAASDKDGGCKKVREFSQCIEKYSWITTGYETFNTKYDCFVVVNCLHYQENTHRKPLEKKKLRKACMNLTQYLWSDLATEEEIQNQINKDIPDGVNNPIPPRYNS